MTVVLTSTETKSVEDEEIERAIAETNAISLELYNLICRDDNDITIASDILSKCTELSTFLGTFVDKIKRGVSALGFFSDKRFLGLTRRLHQSAHNLVDLAQQNFTQVDTRVDIRAEVELIAQLLSGVCELIPDNLFTTTPRSPIAVSALITRELYLVAVRELSLFPLSSLISLACCHSAEILLSE